MSTALAPTQQPTQARTMVYTVDLGNGHVADVEGPEDATPEQLQAAVASQGSTAEASSEAAPLVDGAPGELTMNADAPTQAASQLAPEDQAHLLQILQTGTASQARQFAASKGFAGHDNFDDVIAARDQGAGVNKDVQVQLPKPVESDGAAGSLGRGAADTILFGGLPKLGAAIGATEQSLAGNGDWSTNYDHLLDQNNGVIQGDEADHPIARVTGQLLGGLAIPVGLEGVGLKAGKAALQEGLSMQEARAIAAQAVTRRMAASGAKIGAAHGAISADDAQGAITGAVSEGALGTAGGLAFGKAGEAIAPRMAARAVAARAAPLSDAARFRSAAQRQEIDYLPADVPDALPTQWATSLANLTLGGIPITEGAAKVVQSAKAARDRISQLVGNFRTSDGGAVDTVYAGQRLQKGAQAFLDKSEKRAGDLYEAIPIPSDRPAVLTNTRQALGQLTQGFTSNEALSKLWADNPRLRATLDALTPNTAPIFKGGMAGGGGPAEGATQVGTAFENGALNWQDMKRFRSIVGQIIGRPGLESDGNQIDALRKVYAGLSEDMRATAAGAGDHALKAFERANSYFAARQTRISDTLAPIFGKSLDASPEDAYRALSGWAKMQGGDFAAVARTIRSLPESDANTVRATILNSLGNVSKGRQDQGGGVFSPADFVTHWNGLSDRAKNVLFQGEHRKAIDDLVTVAAGMKASNKFANTSKTGIAVGAASTVAGIVANPIMGALGIAGQIGAGKLLGSPRVARWLAAYARKPNPAAALAHIVRLESIAKAEPQIANDVLQMQERLASAFTGSTTKVAANEPSDESGGIVRQDQQQ